MKNKHYNKTFAIAGTITIIIFSIVLINGCKTPELIANKSGTQLWGENCNRCHDAPDPKTYSDDQWDIVTEHMLQKAVLTNNETNKIRAFLKTAN